MYKERILKAIKVVVILFLVIAISILVILNWKSDLIIDKVMASVQMELVDSLRYEEATLDLFSNFPSTSIQIHNLYLGSQKHPLIRGGDIDIIIGLIPLLKGNILINQLKVTGATIHIENKNGRWSYDILKEKESAVEEAEESQDSSFNTQIKELQIEQTTLLYDDGEGLRFALDIKDGHLEGGFENEILDLGIDLNSVITSLTMDDYQLKESFASSFTGDYKFDLTSGLQEWKDWKIENDAIHLSANGNILRAEDHEMFDVIIDWNKADLESLKKWLPESIQKTWNQYSFSGNIEGQAVVKGKSSKKATPHISSTAKMKNGSIRFLASKQEIKGLDLDLTYDSGAGNKPSASFLKLQFEKDAVLGNSLKGNVYIQNIDNPVVDIDLSGSLPSSLLNLLEMDGIHFEKGTFEINDFKLSGFRTSTSSFDYFVQHGITSLEANDLELIYLNNKISLPSGSLSLSNKKLDLAFDQFSWNKATCKDLKGEIVAKENQIDFTLDGLLCEGRVETKGSVSGMNQRPVSHASWKVTGIEMKKLLESFSNFDQTFITSENLDGKANIWATSVLPFDENWNLLTKSVQVKSAVDIKDGRLKNMKTLEDFSDYVHLSDLQDISFNQLRNYMKIENGIVYLPVMFIQSTALNMSISGEHSFDQDILYYLKLNAGQVAANKLKKNEYRKELKPARKSGWINMYFILSGTTSVVKYQQDRIGVVAGFERTTLLKEELRNYLVDKFGYDVYWLEPNEWEDIPEYQ